MIEQKLLKHSFGFSQKIVKIRSLAEKNAKELEVF